MKIVKLFVSFQNSQRLYIPSLVVLKIQNCIFYDKSFIWQKVISFCLWRPPEDVRRPGDSTSVAPASGRPPSRRLDVRHPRRLDVRRPGGWTWWRLDIRRPGRWTRWLDVQDAAPANFFVTDLLFHRFIFRQICFADFFAYSHHPCLLLCVSRFAQTYVAW